MASFPSSVSSSPLRSRPILISIIAIIIFILFVYTPLPNSCDAHSDAVVCQVAGKAKGKILPADQKWQPTELSQIKSKYAFATFLAGEADAKDDDPYFIAARILTYQLLHANDTASLDRSIPFIILVTDKVSVEKRERLRKDGAIVVLAESITADWIQARVSTWHDVMTKLRLWELTQFDRICMLDGDTVITAPLDGVFNDPAVALQRVKTKPEATKADEGAIPSTYSFAGVPEMNREHGYPPTEEHNDFPNINYLNSGFFVFQPSLDMLNYYLSLLQLPNRFKSDFPEQNLLNYAHRRDGNLPWTQLGTTWNIHYPTLGDLESGVKSLHEKWWAPEKRELSPYMDAWRWRMDGYFEAMDRFTS